MASALLRSARACCLAALILASLLACQDAGSDSPQGQGSGQGTSQRVGQDPGLGSGQGPTNGAASAPAVPAENRLTDALRPALELVNDGRFDEAYALAQEYADREDALPYQAEFLLGFARHKAKRYAAATEHFERAVDLAPDYHPTWHFLGFACHALGDLDRAEEAFRAHEELAPGEGDDAFGLGIVALDRDDLDEAKRQLERALDIHRQVASMGVDRRRELAKVWARLSDVHARRDDWEAARTALVQAVQQFSGHDEIWHKLYQAHLRLGEHDKAAEALAARDQVRAMTGEQR
jgi:tetratricopeptide (TPR) repeat protein